MMQAPPAIDSPSIENIPEALTERPQWVNWRLEEGKGKVPYTPGTERRASSTDLLTWTTFEEAVGAYERSKPPYDGIGFVFCSADPYCGIDLDKCRDPESGEVEEWAQVVIDGVTDAYVEASPSGTGVHIILVGVLPGGAVKTGSIEMYCQDRFFTMTGQAL